MEEKIQKKQNQFLKEKILFSLFLFFTFHDWLRKGQKSITQLCLKIQFSTNHWQINAHAVIKNQIINQTK